jgi:trigger factor
MQRTAAARSEALAQIVTRIAEGAQVDLPAPMIDEAVENDVQRLRFNLAQQGASLEAYLRATEETEDDLRAELRPAAEERLRNTLLLRAIAEREAIAVDDEEINAAVLRLADVARDSQQSQQAEAFARSSRVRNLLESELFERQLTDRLIDLATEGRGAVVNGWEPPASESAESEPATEQPAAAEAVVTEAGEVHDNVEEVPASAP